MPKQSSNDPEKELGTDSEHFLRRFSDPNSPDPYRKVSGVLDTTRRQVNLVCAVIDPDTSKKFEFQKVISLSSFFRQFISTAFLANGPRKNDRDREKIIRWAIAETMGSMQIGDEVTEGQSTIVQERINDPTRVKPVTIGAKNRIFLAADKENMGRYIFGTGETIAVPSESEIMPLVLDEAVEKGKRAKNEELYKTFFQQLLIDEKFDRTIDVGEPPLPVRLRRILVKYINRAYIVTRSRILTEDFVRAMARDFLSFVGKPKLKAGRIGPIKFKKMDDSLKAGSSPLIVGTLNSCHYEEKEKMESPQPPVDEKNIPEDPKRDDEEK